MKPLALTAVGLVVGLPTGALATGYDIEKSLLVELPGFDWAAFLGALVSLTIQVLLVLVPLALWAAAAVVWVYRAGYRRGVAAAANQQNQAAGNWYPYPPSPSRGAHPA